MNEMKNVQEKAIEIKKNIRLDNEDIVTVNSE